MRVELISRIVFSSFPNKVTVTSDIIGCDSNRIYDNVSGIHFVDWSFHIDLQVDSS